MKGKKVFLFIAEIAIFSAIALVFDFVCGKLSDVIWSKGGSISIAMVPIFLMGYRWGWKGGFLCGIVVGTIQLLWGSFDGVASIFLDYIIAYGICGIVCVFANLVKNSTGFMKHLYICLGIFVACMIRLACHVISGMVVYGTPLWGSITYNAPYILISMVLCMIVTCIVMESLKKVIYKNI